jgi:glucose-1-phosphate cytidylyltransferase
MKVVLFCGGYGMRMRHAVHDDIPKPMQTVGPVVCMGRVQ